MQKMILALVCSASLVSCGKIANKDFQSTANSIKENICYKADNFVCDAESAILKYVNSYRKQSGLAPLNLHAKISYVSRVWSKIQADRGYIGHDGFNEQRIGVYDQEFGIPDVEMLGENVAMSGYHFTDADALGKHFTNLWWNSPGHRENMLGRWDLIGIGLAKGRDGWYGTQIFGY